MPGAARLLEVAYCLTIGDPCGARPLAFFNGLLTLPNLTQNRRVGDLRVFRKQKRLAQNPHTVAPYSSQSYRCRSIAWFRTSVVSSPAVL